MSTTRKKGLGFKRLLRMFWLGKGTKENGVSDADKELYLTIHFSDGGWTVATHKTNQEGARHGEGSFPVGKIMGERDLAAVYGECLKKIPKGKQAEITKVNVLVDDMGVRYITRGNKEGIYNSPNDLESFGARLFGNSTNSHAIGFLGQKRYDDPDFFVFSEGSKLQTVGQNLGSFFKRLNCITPTAALVAACSPKDRPFLGLIVGRHRLTAVLVNQSRRRLMVRALPDGLEGIVKRLGERDRTRPNDIFHNLGRKDQFSAITGRPENKLAPRGKVLKKTLDVWADFIAECLFSFENNLLGGRPQAFDCFLPHSKIPGLGEALGARLGMEANTQSQPLWSQYAKLNDQNRINLLEGAPKWLFRIGKTDFTFRAGKVVAMQEVLQEEAMAAEKKHISHEKRQRFLDSISGKRRSKTPAKVPSRKENQPTKATGQSLVQQRNKPAGEKMKVEKGEGVYFALFLSLFLALFYTPYGQYQTSHARMKSSVSSFSTAAKKHSRLLSQSTEGTRQVIVASSSHENKVLWTQKFLSLAEGMSDAVWLSDLFLEESGQQIGESKIIAKNLVIVGSVLPSTEGHILEIAKFVRAMLADNIFFMDDFRDISFDGAYIDYSEGQEIIRFTLKAWYDENKKLETIGNKKKPMVQTSIGEVAAQAEKRNQKAEQSVTDPFWKNQ